MQGGADPATANAELLGLMPEKPCNGYWYGKPGLEQVTPDAMPVPA
jgi:hypothetical protein